MPRIFDNIRRKSLTALQESSQVARRTNSCVSYGKNNMQGYAPQIGVEDRWAIIAYLRALQLSRLGAVDDLAPETRAKLK